MPKVSVLMNCLNGERFVREAIESVYAQSYRDWEIVFWDNASTDCTAEIARSFDDRLRYFRSTQTVPLGMARQFALTEARGEWVALLDHDDIMLPDRLALQMAAIEAGGTSTNYGLSYAGYREIDERGKQLRKVIPQHKSGQILNELLGNFEINIATILMRKYLLEQIKIEMIDTFMMADEYYFCLKLAAKSDVCVVPDVLAVYRQVAGSWSEKTVDRHGKEFRTTLKHLEEDLPEITETCRSGLSLAHARADYSDAQYYMRAGLYAEARQIMSRIRKVRPVFFVLSLLTFLPPVWRLIHRRTLKVKLTALFLRR